MAILLVILLAATPTHVPIGDARQLAEGQTVSIIGRVIVPSARFSTSSDDQGFAMHDETGGIWVSTKENLGFRLEDIVAVRGTLQRKSGKLQIVPASVTRVERRALRVPTGKVGAATYVHIITIEGLIESISSYLPYGHKVFVDDGSGRVQVFVSASTDIDVTRWKAGRTIRVTGFSSQFDTTYEVEPRSRGDIQ